MLQDQNYLCLANELPSNKSSKTCAFVPKQAVLKKKSPLYDVIKNADTKPLAGK